MSYENRGAFIPLPSSSGFKGDPDPAPSTFVRWVPWWAVQQVAGPMDGHDCMLIVTGAEGTREFHLAHPVGEVLEAVTRARSALEAP